MRLGNYGRAYRGGSGKVRMAMASNDQVDRLAGIVQFRGQGLIPIDRDAIAVPAIPTSQTDYTDTLTIPSNDSTKNPLTVAFSGKGRALDARINQIKIDGCGSGLLRLLVSVTNLAGNPVTGLTLANFAVYENGVQETFARDNTANVPISVDLVLDYSGSLSATYLAAIQNAAKKFIDSLAPGDEVGIIKFALTIGQNTPFSTDLNQSVKTAIDLPYPGDIGGTILYDALLTAIDDTALHWGMDFLRRFKSVCFII